MTALRDALLARLDEITAAERAATPGPWAWWNLEGNDQGWTGNGPDLLALRDGRSPCRVTQCLHRPEDQAFLRREENGRHSHMLTEQVIGSHGHDAWGLDIDRADAAFIVAARSVLGPLVEGLADEVRRQHERITLPVGAGEADGCGECAQVLGEHDDCEFIVRWAARLGVQADVVPQDDTLTTDQDDDEDEDWGDAADRGWDIHRDDTTTDHA